MMRFRVLGPLQVWDGAAWSAVPAARLRSLLAVLLIEAGRVVSVDRLGDQLWGERPPARAAATVQVYVGRLRRRLGGGPPGPLVTHDSGYELVAEHGDIDATVFEELVASGREAKAAGRLTEAVGSFSEALRLWRGPALADVAACPLVVTEAGRWEQVRLGALEDRLDIELRLGRHTEVVNELQRLVKEHPLREQLHAYYLMALHRCGRREEAIAAYQNARRVIVDELGLEPGPQLRGVQQAILAGDPEPVVDLAVHSEPVTQLVPAQLPLVAAGFTGRGSQIARLDELLGAVEAVVISTVAGTAGVGKTALAVYWAHRVAGRFPDGQLYVNLRGYAAGPALSPMDALARFLPALGVSTEQIPTELETAAALYRSQLAGKRMLVLLDNARHPDQVRPLLPAGPGALVLVTSRNRLRGLVARDGAVGIDLDVLTVEEACQLLGRLLGPDRVAAEPEATVRLARLCGYLPLALRIAAANLAVYPRTRLADFADRLAGGDRLAALEVDDDPQAGVRAALDHSYAALPADARRLFRLLGLIPGPDFTSETVAALAGLPGPATGRLLEQLATSYLVETDEPGRYRLHDLLRIYAADRTTAEDSEPDRSAALGRLYDHHLGRVDAAARLLYPEMLRLPVPAEIATKTGFPDQTQALAWLDRERPNLVAAVRHAADSGHHRAAWRLADAMRGYLYHGSHAVDWPVVARAGLAGALADRDPRAQAAAHLNLALLHGTLGRYRLAIDHFTKAERLGHTAGWREGQSAALANLATICRRLGQLPEAVEHLEAALAITRELGRTDGEATMLSNLGVVWMMRGRLDQAIEYNTQAVRLHRQTRSRSGEATTLLTLGELHYLAGRLDSAQTMLSEALAVHQATGHRTLEGYTLAALAVVHHTAGRYRQAHELAQAGLATAEQTEDARAECQTLVYWVAAHRDLHHRRRVVAAARRAVSLARASQAPDLEAEALVCLADTLRRAGHPRLAAGTASTAMAVARRVGYRLSEGEALTVLAGSYLDSGQVELAADHAEQAITVNTETGRRLCQARAHQVAGAAKDRLGELGAPDTHRQQARAILTDIGVPLTEPGLTYFDGQDSYGSG
jgi:DNA-binding SARP family transcriptional activator/Tfp pilus assembly protein PilF